MSYKKIKYPRLTLFVVTLLLAAVLFYEGINYAPLHEFIVSLGYIGTFIGGIFYAYGFTAAPATAVLLVLAKEQTLIMAVIIGGLGAVLSDFIIFKFLRSSFNEEIDHLKKEKFVKFMEKEEKAIFGHYYKFIFPALAGFLIASPLPSEIGVAMMSSIKKISIKKFLLIAFALHSLGILIILYVGNII